MKLMLLFFIFNSICNPKSQDMERKLLADFNDQKIKRETLLNRIKNLPSDITFKLEDEWKKVENDEKLEAWRRVAAAKILMTHFIDYPCDWEEYMQHANNLLGIKMDQWREMSIAQAIPFPIDSENQVMAALLEIPADAGKVAIYVAVDRVSKRVRDFAFVPEL
jgi:hypothetical protein